MIARPLIAGVDGCKAGWIAAIAPADDIARPLIRVVARFADLLDGPDAPALIAVDMPIGLPDRIVGSGRGPEQAVRPLLGGRQSSVFSIPARAAVEADDYPQCCLLALAASDPPRKVSKQGFHLFPKIREIDALMRGRPDLASRIREVHPELAFRLMKGAPLAEPKKVKGAAWLAGLAERRTLLLREGVGEAAMTGPSPRGAGMDDLIDALAGLVAASHIAAGRGLPFPNPPLRDSHGIPVAIWGWRDAGGAPSLAT
jgi:predicted RNase H-like nuclease